MRLIRTLILVFSLALFLPSNAQKNVTEEDLNKLIYFLELGDIEEFNSYKAKLKGPDMEKDSLYFQLLIFEIEFYSRMEDFEGMIKPLEELIVMDTIGYPNLHTHLGASKLRTGDFEGALAAYERAYMLDSTYDVYINNRVNGLIWCNRHEDALDLLNRTQVIEKSLSRNFFYAECYYALDSLELAKEFLEAYLKEEHGSTNFEGYLLAAEITIHQKDFESTCIFITEAKKNMQQTNTYIKKQEEQGNHNPFILLMKKRLDRITEIEGEFCL